MSSAPQDSITLNGKPLSFRNLVKIGNYQIGLTPDPTAMQRVREARKVVDERLAAGLPIYGTTTGVGAMKDIEWTADELDQFNMGLVRAHHFGTGAPFPNSVVRNAMAIRANTALTGRVGCTAELVETYLSLLAADVVPVVRRTGSIGCADIGLMGQIGAVLTGVGEAVYQNRRMSAEAALAEAGLKP
ncbi:MAG TPA: aromatic amino acid lyase, partial [Arsenicitalea sp.]|nr:aromatic amino acid lyase [Arsenicitalea sp.]